MIQNTGGSSIQLTGLKWWSHCAKYRGRGVPSLTGWGMIILVMLLAGTALWVIRKRRVVLAR